MKPKDSGEEKKSQKRLKNQENQKSQKSLSEIVIENNRYKIPELNGRKVPRVTTVTDLFDKSRGLMKWSARITAEYAMQQIQMIQRGELRIEDIIRMDLDAFVKEAKSEHDRISKRERDRGSRVHEITEKIFRMMIVNRDIDLGEIEEDLLTPLNALYEWIRDNDFRPLEIERIVWSTSFRGYGGKLDVIGLYNKRLLTIDVKAATGIYEDSKMQVAAYDHAYEERNPGTYTDGAGILRLDKQTGMYEFAEYPKHLVKGYLEQFGQLCLLCHCIEDTKIIEREIKVEKKERRKELKKEAIKAPKVLPYEDPF